MPPSEIEPLLVSATISHSSSNYDASSCDGASSAKRDDEAAQQDTSFLFLIATNHQFRLYLASSLISHAGEWFTYIACVRFIQTLFPGNYTVISVLVTLRLIPKLLFSTLGGVLSDALDRRHNMICLDILSVVVSLLYLLAIQLQSVVLIYVLVFCQEMIAALYLPSSEAIYPQIVPNEKLMEKGAVISEAAYAIVAAFGASLGGFCVLWFGIRACFVLDSISYLLSALLLAQLHGEWTADEEEYEDDNSEKEDDVSSEDKVAGRPSPNGCLDKYRSMATNGFIYIWKSKVGPFVLIKASGMMLYGAVEVIAVAVSEKPDDPGDSSARLGIIYGFYGIGCVFGPFVSNAFTDIERPRTLQAASIISFGIITLSWFGLAYFDQFVAKCLFMSLSSFGAEILWLDSDLLLLKYSKNEFLGRVSALDDTLSVSCEALSALLAGVLQDHVDLSAENVCWTFSIIGIICVVAWTTYHLRSKGKKLASIVA